MPILRSKGPDIHSGKFDFEPEPGQEVEPKTATNSKRETPSPSVNNPSAEIEITTKWRRPRWKNKGSEPEDQD